MRAPLLVIIISKTISPIIIRTSSGNLCTMIFLYRRKGGKTQLENEILCALFSEQEVKKAVFEMEHNKAPGPNGFPAEFYQFFQETIKGDLMQLFYDFHQGTLPIHSLNFGVITLLPKKADASRVQQFRPICLLNVSFKIFTKVLTNRLSLVANKVIRPSQNAFIPGSHILERVVILHETLHEMHRKKRRAGSS